MKEKLIIVPNDNELLLTLAYHNINSFNVRVITSLELADIVLTRAGKTVDGRFLSRKEETPVYASIAKTIDYFKDSNINDINQLASSIDTLRMLVVDDEEDKLKEGLNKGTFDKKNSALYDAYAKYKEKGYLDSVAVLREAVDIACNLNAKLYTLKELPLLPLELSLVNKLGQVQEISLKDLYKCEEKPLKIVDYRNCYGNSNEAENIISSIYRDNGSLDDNVIALADTSENQLFYDLAVLYDVKISFGMGIPMINSYPGKLLKLYGNWANEGAFGKLPLMQMLNSPYFNKAKLLEKLGEKENDWKCSLFYKLLGDLRLTNDSAVNAERIANYRKVSEGDPSYVHDREKLKKYEEDLNAVSEILSMPIEQFISEYSVIRMAGLKNNADLIRKLDESAIGLIGKEIASFRDAGFAIGMDTIESILKKNALRERMKPGYIHLTSIEGALTSLRKNLYVCGLSAAAYPGAPKENSLLLDEDLHNFGNESLTSEGRIVDKRNKLLSLISLANGLGNAIHLSYPGLNVSELKTNNASSLMFEIYKLENGSNKSLADFEEDVVKVDYFEPGLSASAKVGKAYNDGNEIVTNEKKPNDETLKIKKNYFSPSALSNYFNCPMSFFLGNIVGIPQPDEYRPYEILAANEVGTFVHSMMEYLGDNKSTTKEEFHELGAMAFDEYMKLKVPMIAGDIEKEKEEVLIMLDNAYEMDRKNVYELVLSEEDVKVEHESGLVIHGFPDRVEKRGNKYVVVDFKTGRSVKHKDNDAKSCLQALIYAYILEKNNICKVDHCEFWYPRLGRIVKCKYDDENKDKLSALLSEVKNTIDNGDFKPMVMNEQEEKDICKYCKYGSICGKVVTDDN